MKSNATIKSNKESIELAGIYAVASQLSRLNYIPFVLSRKAPKIDLLVYNPTNLKTTGIQVKTTSTKDGWDFGWYSSEQEFLQKSGEWNCIYVLVSISKEYQYPKFYVLEGQELSNILTENTKVWIEEGKKKGKNREKSAWKRVSIQLTRPLFEKIKKSENQWVTVKKTLEKNTV